MLIFDAHNHLGSRSTDDGASAAELIEELRSSGVGRVITSPKNGALAKTAAELTSGNREALELYHRYPDFVYPGAVVNPLFPAESLEFLREFQRNGLVWAGEWLTYITDIAFDQLPWRRFFDFCAEHRMIVQLHSDRSVAEVARLYPELVIVSAQLNDEVLPLLLEFPNVYLDISGFCGGLCRNSLTSARQTFGTDRLLFGTDFPIYDVDPFICRARRDFPVPEQEQLFHANVERLLSQSPA